MRTIKFRGKVLFPKNKLIIITENNVKEGDWVYGELHINSRIPHIHTGLTSKFPIDTNTVGQFTGLYDKNGKEIYEGDVIKWLEIQGTNNNSLLEPPDDRIVEMSGVVEFKDGMFSVLNEDKLFDTIVAYLTKDYQANESNMFEYVYNLDKFPNITIDDMYICEVIGNIYDNKEQTQNIKQ